MIVIRKYITVILLIFILSYYNTGYTNEVLKPHEITIDKFTNDSKALENAIDEVADGGTVYIEYRDNNYIFNDIIVNKNVKIIGLKDKYGNTPSIAWTGSKKEEKSPFFTLRSTYFFHVENLHFFLSPNFHNKILFESYVPNLTMEGVSTDPFIISYSVMICNPPKSDSINISINNCNFHNLPPKVHFTEPLSGIVNFSQCYFTGQSIVIKNNGSNIQIHDNVFDNAGVMLEKHSYGLVEVYDNDFISKRTVFNIYNPDQINIHHNRINSKKVYIENEDETMPLNVNKNWWGSVESPKMFTKNKIVCDIWAVNEDCTVFFDPSISPDETLQGYGKLKNCFSHEGTQVELMVDNNIVSSTVTDNLGKFSFPNIDFNAKGLLIFSHEGFKSVSQEVYGTNESVIIDLNHSINSLDLNNDGKVDSLDTAILAQGFGNDEESPNFNKKLDFNRNGIIDLLDLIILIRFKGDLR